MMRTFAASLRTGLNGANVLIIMTWFEKIIPAAAWLKTYSKIQLRGDASAGITVGIILIPQGMAYAMIAGLPPVYGLYAALIPLFVYAFLGTSRELSVGPVAMDSLFVAATVSVIAAAGTDRYIELALLLALMIGILQLIFGLLRLGFLVNFLSKPVIVGFTAAAALIIACNQLGLLIGVNLEKTNQLHLLLYDLGLQIHNYHLPTLIFGISGIAFLVIAKKIRKKFPASLVLIALGILVVFVGNLEQYGIAIVKNVPSGLPSFHSPDLSKDDLLTLLPAALALSLIAFMEAITVSKAIEEKKGTQRVQPNKELIALGASNLVGSFFSSYPVTGGFSRSAVNSEAGAKTPLAGLFSACIILFALLFLTDLFYFLPKVLLGVIIIIAVLGLIDLKSLKNWWRTDRVEFAMCLLTFIATATIGITEGIFIGVMLSLAVIIYKVSHPHMVVVGKIPGTNLYRNADRFANVEIDPEVMIVRFDAGLFYANADFFRDKIMAFESAKARLSAADGHDSQLKAIIVDASGINSVDTSAILMIRKLMLLYRRKKIQLLFSGLIGPVRDKFNQNRIYTELGEEFFFVNIEEAEKYLRGEKLNYEGQVARQANFKLRTKR